MGIFSIFKGNKTAYFPGCSCYFNHKDNFELYKKILSRLGIDFKVVDKKLCCGLPALEAGYDSETRKIARRNFEVFSEEGINTIITSDPGCYKMFSLDYPKILPDWNIKVDNIWKLILEKLEFRPGLIKTKAIGTVTYQDSCYLGRYLDIYDEPRKILELIGYEVKEMFDSKSTSICCGSCGGLMFTNPELADEIAKERILQAKRIGVKRIIVSSLAEYELLKRNCKESGLEVFEMSQILAIALGIKNKEDFEKLKEEVEDEIVLDNKEEEFNKEVEGVLEDKK